MGIGESLVLGVIGMGIVFSILVLLGLMIKGLSTAVDAAKRTG